MAEPAGELLEWVKLPEDLQHKFFELAEQEAATLTETIQRLSLQLKELKGRLQPYIHRLPTSEGGSTVAAVDSSRSPRLNERLGVRYGVFATGVVFLKGYEERSESFRAGVFKRRQALSTDRSRRFFDLLTTYAERKAALEALDRCDLLILDGSFYGFVYGAALMKKSEMLGEAEQRILGETFEATELLRESGKVVGVIKRSHTRAIGGYLALEDRENPFTKIIDKLILSSLMPAKSYFNYREFLGEKPVPIYSRIAHLASIKWREEFMARAEDFMAEAEKRVFTPFEVLGLEREGLKKLRRLQVRAFGGLSPCEIEYPLNLNEARLLQVLGEEGFFNEATNLPMALDLVDSMVGLSSKFTEEFVSEVEGRVLESTVKSGGDQEAVKIFFTFLNPQKPF